MTLNLDFTEEQIMLRRMVRGLCADLAPLELVRDLEDDPDGIAVDLWDQFGRLGLCGLMAPESCGGAGMSLVDGMVVYEELGRSLAPLPHFAGCVLAAGAAAAAGDPEQQTRLLPGIADGSSIATVAWLEPGGGFKPRGVQLEARSAGGGFVLRGSKMHVPFAASADLFVVLARTGGEPADVGLFAVPSGAPRLSMSQRMSIGSDAQYRVDFDGVRVPAAACLGDPRRGWDAWERAMQPAAVLAAAQAVGGALHALEITVEYAKTRRQFGKMLAEFQSISHYLADARTALDGARLLVQEASWAHSVGRDIRRLAPMAKLLACRAFRDVTAMAQQVFGGIGFTLEHDIQLYFRRAKQLQLNWWDPAACEDRVADAILGPVAPAARPGSCA